MIIYGGSSRNSRRRVAGEDEQVWRAQDLLQGGQCGIAERVPLPSLYEGGGDQGRRRIFAQMIKYGGSPGNSRHFSGNARKEHPGCLGAAGVLEPREQVRNLRRDVKPHFSPLVAEFARIPSAIYACRNSGEFRYEVLSARPFMRSAG